MRRHTTIVLGLVAATSLLTACGSSDTDVGAQPSPGTSSSGTTTTPATQSPTAQPTATPARSDVKAGFPSGTGSQVAKNKGAWNLVLRDVRVSERDGFDRVLVELKGTGTPGWSAEYVETPRAEGSGEVVDVRGDNVLGVAISGVILPKGYPKTPADLLRGPRHFAPQNGGDVKDINVGGPFEGYSQLFLGIDGDKAPFRVFALTNPSRLVVDVKDD